MEEAIPPWTIQAVRKNIKRFPDDFVFSLTRAKIMDLSQTMTGPKIKNDSLKIQEYIKIKGVQLSYSKTQISVVNKNRVCYNGKS